MSGPAPVMLRTEGLTKSFGSLQVARDISAVTYTPIPLLIVASLWYLLFTSLLMIGQYFLEKRFSRGVNARRPDRNEPALATGALPAAGAPDGNDRGGKG